MNYGLFDINDEYNRPKFWLARPNKRIITRLKELDNIVQFSPKLSGIDEVSGELPTVLVRNYESVPNPHIKHFKNKYLLKMEFMGIIEWFVIELISQNASEEKDSIPFTAYNLAYNLRGKKLYNDKYEGKTIREVVDDMLLATSWSIGKVSTEIGGKIRSFDEFGVNTNVLEALNTVIESYGCIMDFDSDKKLINFLHKDDYYLMKNLMLNDKNYIVSMERSMETTEIVTRLFPTGEEGLSINSVTPTGKSYIDRYDWFMYPFQRDSNKKTIKSSDYMSDELCHAILNQQEKIAEITPLVKEKTDLMNEAIDSLIPLQDTIDEKRLAYEICEGILDTMRGNQEYEYSDFSNGNDYTFNYRKGWYAIQFRALSGTGTLTIGKENHSATTSWKTVKFDKSTLDALSEGEKSTITKLTGNVEFMCVSIPETEFKTFTDQQILDKYNIMQKKLELDNANSSLATKKSYIDSLQKELDALQLSASDDKFYTLELLEERSEFIYEYHWEETTHTKAQELYDDSLEKMKELHKPVTNISTNIHNFLDSLEDKRNWKKLVLGSRVLMKHSRLGTYDEVMLTEITYDFSGGSIGLVLSDVRNLNEDEFKQLIMQGANASSTLNLNKHLYDNAVKQSQTFDKILNSEWDAVKNAIVAGVNESVTFSNRGLVIKSPDKPKDLLIGTSGVLAISNDGGQTFKNAITKDGIVAERLVGKIIIGNKMVVRDDEGTLVLNGSLMTIKDRNDKVKLLTGEYAPNKFGMQIFDGAFEFKTHSNTVKQGMTLNSNGIITKDSTGKTTFEIDSTTGSVKMSSGTISWGDVNTPTASQVGARPNNWIPSESDVVGSKLTKITSNGVYTGTIEANQIYAGTISGFTINGSVINGSTINSTNGSLTTTMTGGKLQFYNNGQDFGSLTPQSLTFKYTDVFTNGDRISRTSAYDGGALSLESVVSSTGQVGRITISSFGISTIGNAGVISGDRLSINNSSVSFASSTPVSIGGTLSVDKSVTLYNSLYVNRATTIDDTLRVTGTCHVGTSVYLGPGSIGIGGKFNGSPNSPNMSIGSSNIYAPGTIYAGGNVVTSSRDKKKNINTFAETVLPVIENMRPVTYQLKTDKDFDLHRLGFILEELGLVELVAPFGGVDQYALITLAIKGLQELNEKVKKLDHEK